MRWSTYLSPTDGTEHVALARGDELLGLREPSRLLDLLGDDGSLLAEAAGRAAADPWEVLPVAGARLRAPIPVPPSIRDFMAFEEHVTTSSAALGHEVEPVWYEQPIFYFTNPAAVRGPNDDVPVAPGSAAFDYELEVGAVIGRRGADVDPSDGESYIAGYLVLCDWSARDLQAHEMRGNLGPAKAKDTATSLGPWLVTPDELAPRRAGNAYDLAMHASVNGRQYSSGNLSTIYWSFAEMVAYASRGTEVRPGDILGSGTVGTGCILELSRVHGGEAYPWLVPGDHVELTIAELGSVAAGVVEGRPVVPLR